MNDLIIEISYYGLGDHLFHSHIPRIAKETNVYKRVYLSNYSNFGHSDYKKLIWEMNPFIDGFVNYPGVKCDIGTEVHKAKMNPKYNLLDKVMHFYGLENNTTWNQPEIYYVPSYKSIYNHVIYDPNFVSWIGNVTAEDAMIFFTKKKHSFDYIMKIRGKKTLFIPNTDTKFIETPTLFDFCDLIHSSKKLYCLTSGTATLSAALKKSSIVFYGREQEPGYRHYTQHDYQLIPRYLLNRIKKKLKIIYGK